MTLPLGEPGEELYSGVDPDAGPTVYDLRGPCVMAVLYGPNGEVLSELLDRSIVPIGFAVGERTVSKVRRS